MSLSVCADTRIMVHVSKAVGRCAGGCLRWQCTLKVCKTSVSTRRRLPANGRRNRARVEFKWELPAQKFVVTSMPSATVAQHRASYPGSRCGVASSGDWARARRRCDRPRANAARAETSSPVDPRRLDAPLGGPAIRRSAPAARSGWLFFRRPPAQARLAEAPRQGGLQLERGDRRQVDVAAPQPGHEILPQARMLKPAHLSPGCWKRYPQGTGKGPLTAATITRR